MNEGKNETKRDRKEEEKKTEEFLLSMVNPIFKQYAVVFKNAKGYIPLCVSSIIDGIM